MKKIICMLIITALPFFSANVSAALVSRLTGEASSVLTALAVVYPPSQAYIDLISD